MRRVMFGGHLRIVMEACHLMANAQLTMEATSRGLLVPAPTR